MKRTQEDKPIDREPMREPMRPALKMKHKPNWESLDPTMTAGMDRFHINPERIPEGMSALWVTDSCLGQPQTHRRSVFEAGGWTPVHGEDFDGLFDGEFMPKGAQGEIKLESSVLMMRPIELTEQAKLQDKKEALNKVRASRIT